MRTAVVRRFAEFTNEYPWGWTAADAEAFTTQTHSGGGIAVSTARGHQNALRMFMEYLCDPRYSWSQVCAERFGARPVQILHEWNSVVHTSPYEGSPGRWPLTYNEVQALFDAADLLVEQIRARGRKGASAAQRDATLLKLIYAFGLRRREAWGLDVEDLRRNPRAPGHGRVGALFVRWGKSSNGSPPKRRTVLLVPEMDWVVPVLESWLDVVRPSFEDREEGPMWVTERRTRMSPRAINTAFANARDAAGLAPELDLHSLRHSYVTHLVEFDYPERFVQDQVGHVFASTTAIYTGVSDEYRNRLLQRALDRNADRWEAQ
jgi:site-specific recombinase XerD